MSGAYDHRHSSSCPQASPPRERTHTASQRFMHAQTRLRAGKYITRGRGGIEAAPTRQKPRTPPRHRTVLVCTKCGAGTLRFGNFFAAYTAHAHLLEGFKSVQSATVLPRYFRHCSTLRQTSQPRTMNYIRLEVMLAVLAQSQSTGLSQQQQQQQHPQVDTFLNMLCRALQSHHHPVYDEDAP